MGEADGDFYKAEDVFIAVACAAIYRREVIEKIGLFDEDFFTGYEDVDWSFRAILSGYRIVNEPKAVVYHKASATQIYNSSSFVYNGQKNVSVIFFKNMPTKLIAKYLLLHMSYILGSMIYFAKIGRLWPFLKAKAEVVSGFHEVMRKRRIIQSNSTRKSWELETLLDRDWLKNKMIKMFNYR